MLMYCELWPKVPKLNSTPVYCSRLYGSWLKFLGKNLRLVVCATVCAKSEVMLTHTYITHAFMQGDYANAPTETEALTSFLDDYKDAMENRKAGGRSFRWRRWCILLSFLKYGFGNYELMNSRTLVSWSFPDIWTWRGLVYWRAGQKSANLSKNYLLRYIYIYRVSNF